MIEMKHVNINFGDQVIFNDAHFKTCPGRITGIIGKSGCGKTTFLKSLLSQYKDNILYVDNVVINNSNKEDYLLNKVSYIDQFGTFFDNMKVYEHFEFILEHSAKMLKIVKIYTILKTECTKKEGRSWSEER